MIHTYFWLPRLDQVGHCSALVGSESDEHSCYISWWPATPAGPMKPVLGRSHSPEQDKKAEGRDADAVLQIDDLDEKAASQWWADFASNDHASYNLRSQNCSWAVITALKAAGSDKFIPWHQFFQRFNIPNTLGILDGSASINLVMNYTLDVMRLYSSGMNAMYSIKRPMVDVGDEISSTWSPKDALAYCGVLQKNIERARTGAKLWIPDARTLLAGLG
jgi:hypothetical protein